MMMRMKLMIMVIRQGLDLRYERNCVISVSSRTFREVPNADLVTYEVATQTTSATFQINNAKPYAPVITLSINDDIKFLENINNNFLEQI